MLIGHIQRNPSPIYAAAMRKMPFTMLLIIRSMQQTMPAGNLREDDIYRAMRLLVNSGFYSTAPQVKGRPVLFRNNGASATLRSDHPTSVRHLVQLFPVLVLGQYTEILECNAAVKPLPNDGPHQVTQQRCESLTWP